MTYFEILYKDEESPINQAALRSQLDNIARLTNYYDDLSDFYTDHTKIMITQEKLRTLVDYSHVEILFLVFTNILDWEHYKSSLLFPTDKTKEKLLKEFLARLASSEIKDVDDIVDLEQVIETFIEDIEA
jgi:GTP1/Obg family GTP-binding protein